MYVPTSFFPSTPIAGAPATENFINTETTAQARILPDPRLFFMSFSYSLQMPAPRQNTAYSHILCAMCSYKQTAPGSSATAPLPIGSKPRRLCRCAEGCLQPQTPPGRIPRQIKYRTGKMIAQRQSLKSKAHCYQA